MSPRALRIIQFWIIVGLLAVGMIAALVVTSLAHETNRPFFAISGSGSAKSG